jgi:hypothetical protein
VNQSKPADPLTDDIKASISLAARVAVDRSVPLTELSDLLQKEYESAQAIKQRPKAFEPARPGSFVTYVDPKKGPLLAHVLDVYESNKIKLRAHLTAQPDFDRDQVPFSDKPSPGHWSFR